MLNQLRFFVIMSQFPQHFRRCCNKEKIYSQADRTVYSSVNVDERCAIDFIGYRLTRDTTATQFPRQQLCDLSDYGSAPLGPAA